MADSSVVFLNGRFLSRSQACVSIDDRGFVFADGVYEVLRTYGGRPFAFDAHRCRLTRSLEAVAIPEPEIDFAQVTARLIEENRTPDARVYWQVTRGVQSPRAYSPEPELAPTVLALVDPAPTLDEIADRPPPVLTAHVSPDPRWARCDVKSLMLLPAVMETIGRPAHPAHGEPIPPKPRALTLWHRGHVVTEAGSANVFAMVDGVLRTHPVDERILEGVTRRMLIELAHALDPPIPVEQRPVTVEQLIHAEEIIACGTTLHVASVTLGANGDDPTPAAPARSDDEMKPTRPDERHAKPGAASAPQTDRSASGFTSGPEPGPVARRLHEALMARIRQGAP